MSSFEGTTFLIGGFDFGLGDFDFVLFDEIIYDYIRLCYFLFDSIVLYHIIFD